jgi:hypothetical protein
MKNGFGTGFVSAALTATLSDNHSYYKTRVLPRRITAKNYLIHRQEKEQ